MKKILSLMCALWACVMMGFAMEVAVPATVLDLQNPTSIEAGWYGTIAYSLSKNALVVSGYESYKSVDKQTWITQESVGSTGIEWAGEAPFKGSAYYSNATAAQLNSSRHIAYLITGCDSIWCYGYNNSATCYLAMNIYELTDAPVAVIDDATATKTYSLDNSAAGGKASGIMKQALDATKTYLVEAYGTGTSNSRVFEMAFFRHPGGASSDVKTLYCKMEHNWWTQGGAAIGAYAWGTEGSNAGWPGVRMTPVEGQANLWKTEIDAVKYPNIIFTRMNPNDGDNQDWGAKTVDLTIPTDDKDLFTIASAEVWGDPGCQGEWSKYDPSSTPVDPGDKVAIRLVPGVWNVDGAKFACLTTNEGTAATVDIASLAAKAVISDWFVGGDTVVGLIPADTKVIAFGRLDPATPDLSIMSIMANLWNHSDILDLDPSLIYTITDWGGDYSPGYWGEGSVTPVEGFYITGSDNLVGADKAWHADAIKVEGDSYTFENLAAGDYKLKITLDGTWGTVKGYDELTVKPEGVSADTDRNICFTLAEPGNVTVTYTAAQFTVEGNFYVKPIDPNMVEIRLVPGVWNVDGAKFACLTTNEGTAATVDIASLAAKAVISDWFVGGDTVVGLIPADTKVIAFGRLNPATPDLSITSIMMNLWNHSDILDIDESLIYTITGWGEGEGDIPSPGYWGEGSVTPVEGFYITGSDNLVGTDKAWHADAIKVDGTSYTFKNLAAGDYLMKITLDGQWETGTAKGFSALTVTPEGVNTDKDDNICFTLAEIGDVTVTYTGAVFTVEGSFYVKPVDPSLVAIRLVPGVWNQDGARFACLTTNQGTAETVDIAWLAANAVISDWFTAGDTAIGYIPADTKVIAFGRINPAAPDLSITSIMANLWNHSDILDIDESLLYTIDGWGSDDYSPGHWGNNVPQEEWYLVGDMTDWENNKISFENGPIKVALNDVGRTYAFKILKLFGGEKTWFGNKGTMDRQYNQDWIFSNEVQENCSIILEEAGEYTFRLTLDQEGVKVSVDFPEQGEGIEDIDASAKAVKVVHNGQVMILRGEHIYTVMGQEVK